MEKKWIWGRGGGVGGRGGKSGKKERCGRHVVYERIINDKRGHKKRTQQK